MKERACEGERETESLKKAAGFHSAEIKAALCAFVVVKQIPV